MEKYVCTVCGYTYDPEAARALLKEAGYAENEVKFELSMDSSADSGTQLVYASISEQLKKTQISESRSLTFLAVDSYANGEYREALDYVLNALPGRGPGRPYVPIAEKTLASLVDPYGHASKYRFLQSVTGENEIEAVAASDDGVYFATLDIYGTLTLYNMTSGEKIWDRSFKEIDDN